MLKEFKDHIDNRLPFLTNGKLLIACSGGLDSVILARLCQSLKLTYAIAHCNFRLREEESDGDELFIKSLADELGVPFFITHFDTEVYAKKHTLSIQMAARELRYDWFRKKHLF